MLRKHAGPGVDKWFQFAWESLAEPMPDEEEDATDELVASMAMQLICMLLESMGDANDVVKGHSVSISERHCSSWNEWMSDKFSKK